MNIYKPIQLAEMYGIHPNTIRLYERLGFISSPQREANNYRVFTNLHVLQVKVCRCIFGCPFTNKRIRNAGNEIMWASGKQLWDKAEQCTEQYIEIIGQEITTAKNTANMLHCWANPDSGKEVPVVIKQVSRKEIANYFGITIEAVRNWERNNLIVSNGAGKKGEILYSSADVERMSVIYMLLQAGYSVAAIHHSLFMYDKGNVNLVVPALNNPEYDDLVSVGDRWLSELSGLIESAYKIPIIFDKLKML